MKILDFIWLASYPRSGNTYLRIILWHAFGLRSASVYPNDLGRNKKLEKYAGHVQHSPQLLEELQKSNLPMIKTHEHNKDNRPAIYILRDGRAASVSLWEFYNRTIPIESIINGQHRFGTWAKHVQSWDPWERPNTLLLKYEYLRDNLTSALNDIADFLDIDIITTKIPDRNVIAGEDGRWVKTKTNWRSHLQGDSLDLFMKLNEDILYKAGYL